jgi:hypothetical protein
MSSEPGAKSIQVPLVWVGSEEVPILFGNAFIAQFVQPDQVEFVITVGQMVPPALFGSPEQVEAQAKQVSFVPVKTVARIGLTRQRIIELAQVLQTVLEQHNQAQRGSR